MVLAQKHIAVVASNLANQDIVAGIDPGKSGAMVVLRGIHVVEILTWDTTEDVGPRVFEVVTRLRVARVAVEWGGRHVGYERMGKDALITLGRRAQMAMTGARCGGAIVVEVGCDDWRKSVLRLSTQTSGETAKLCAEWACWGGGWRKDPVDLGLTWPPGIERSNHVAEAACLAVYAQNPPTPKKGKRR